MPRGYRCVLIALVGLGLAQAERAAAKPNDAATKNVSESLRNIASALQDANKPSQHDKPCAEGRDDRSSDLCAQWKAADAAQSSANATWIFGYVGSLLGLLTLATAGAAAWYARKAALHTEESALTADDALKQQREEARPWLTIAADMVEVSRNAGDAKNDPNTLFLYRLSIRNVGHTVARGVFEFHWVFDVNDGWQWAREKLEDWKTVQPGGTETVAPGEELSRIRWHGPSDEDLKSEDGDIIHPGLLVFVRYMVGEEMKYTYGMYRIVQATRKVGGEGLVTAHKFFLQRRNLPLGKGDVVLDYMRSEAT